MRKITPSFPCPKCGEKLEDCCTSGEFDLWGLSRCTNKDCDYVIDAYDLNQMGEKVIYC